MTIFDLLLKNEYESYTILGHEVADVDSIASGILLERFINKYTRSRATFKIPDKVDNETLNVFKNANIDITKYQHSLNPDDKNFILVDHSDDKRIDSALMIIDHHPGVPSSMEKNAIYYKNILSSSTSTLLEKDSEQFFSKEDIYLSLLGLYLDTASFNSTKTLEEDKKWAESMIKKYDFDKQKLYQLGLCLTDISDMSISEVVVNGLKKYSYKEKSIESSYIQIEELSDDKLNQILNYLKTYLIKNKLHYFIFIVHNMKNMKTTTYTVSEDNIEITKYDNYTSRGSNIIPGLFQKIDNENKMKGK